MANGMITSETRVAPCEENNYGLPSNIHVTGTEQRGDSIVVTTSNCTYVIPNNINSDTNVVYWFHGGDAGSYANDVGLVKGAAGKETLNSIVVIPGPMSYD